MANIKVSEMTEATSFDDGDYTMIVQANQNKKISKENIFSDLENEISTNTSDISTINNNIGDLSDLETEDKSSVVNSINELKNTTTLWEGSELPAGKTYRLTDNIYNYRLAIVEGQWGNKFVIPIIQGNTYFNGGMNYPQGNGINMITTGISGSIVDNGASVSITYFRQLTHTQNGNHGGFENPQLYKIIGIK